MTLREKIKKAGKNAIVYVSTLSMLSLGGCFLAHLKTLTGDDILNIKRITNYSDEAEGKVDYTEMTWQEAIAYVKTPEQAQHYLNTHFEIDLNEYARGFNILGINFFTKGETFKYNHTRRKGVCIDYATAAAALLSDDDYPPLLLHMKCEDKKSCHVVFLYKTEEGFGALGNTPEKPVYATIDKLVTTIGEEYEYFSIVNLDENFKDKEWIDGDIDLQGYFMDKWVKINYED